MHAQGGGKIFHQTAFAQRRHCRDILWKRLGPPIVHDQLRRSYDQLIAEMVFVILASRHQSSPARIAVNTQTAARLILPFFRNRALALGLERKRPLHARRNDLVFAAQEFHRVQSELRIQHVIGQLGRAAIAAASAWLRAQIGKLASEKRHQALFGVNVFLHLLQLVSAHLRDGLIAFVIRLPGIGRAMISAFDLRDRAFNQQKLERFLQHGE